MTELAGFCARALLAALAFLSVTAAYAQSARGHVRRADTATVSPPASLAAVAWLEGHWIGEMPEGPVDQVFLPPAKGQMPSFVRAINADGIIFYEISNLIERDGTIVIQLRHFTPQLVGWEDGSGPIERRLIAIEGGNLYFDRVSFIRSAPDRYTIYFLNMDGEEERETLTVPFHRVRG